METKSSKKCRKCFRGTVDGTNPSTIFCPPKIVRWDAVHGDPPLMKYWSVCDHKPPAISRSQVQRHQPPPAAPVSHGKIPLQSHQISRRQGQAPEQPPVHHQPPPAVPGSNPRTAKKKKANEEYFSLDCIFFMGNYVSHGIFIDFAGYIIQLIMCLYR